MATAQTPSSLGDLRRFTSGQSWGSQPIFLFIILGFVLVYTLCCRVYAVVAASSRARGLQKVENVNHFLHAPRRKADRNRHAGDGPESSRVYCCLAGACARIGHDSELVSLVIAVKRFNRDSFNYRFLTDEPRSDSTKCSQNSGIIWRILVTDFDISDDANSYTRLGRVEVDESHFDHPTVGLDFESGTGYPTALMGTISDRLVGARCR
ncbi:hypothetical protein GGX14DRAFT_405510 [Mycena pura]|uniref:Uncharacterized protein n=1 Tax=Mycena pura TaxID=153505 RepID=A0AAD6Y6E3_9AGAR|nr:hypothetical protein GGX14DRAFT_405510 [Mycena pura]